MKNRVSKKKEEERVNKRKKKKHRKLLRKNNSMNKLFNTSVRSCNCSNMPRLLKLLYDAKDCITIDMSKKKWKQIIHLDMLKKKLMIKTVQFIDCSVGI